ncbi:MAG: MerR family transcriptional regulator [Myxococcales bacterium]|nr:MerR family transcriptional regulator [Myxococcales bacterium]MDH5305600.1 MerR family transcriptional regulator [Myxococcales bacterium]MDH5565246.1 MerR family transcriptional regulator [Myxococcales bacterium]
MEYRVEELAAAADVGVDTVRFYQGRGLLPSPRREGRVAVYDRAHLERLRRIRALQRQGFTLAQIRRVLAGPTGSERRQPLLEALVEEGVGKRMLSRAALAREAGIPEALIQAALAAGLLVPLVVDGEERFSEADLEMARAGLALLEAGFPLQTLLERAVTHARHVQDLVDAAIELFDDHVRKAQPDTADSEAITRAFRTLLPLATRLVAVHFQRTLVTRALHRLRGKDELKALEAALEATEAAHLEVEVAWKE